MLWISSNNPSNIGPSINIANRMKKKRMMEANVLQSKGNVAFCGKTKTPNDDNTATIVFDSLLNLVRNLLPCNVSRLKLMHSSILLKALLKLEYIHDYNVVSIFHNLTSRAPNVCRYIFERTKLLDLLARSLNMLVDDEAFYDSFELLQMKYFSICTIHNILLARLNNINFAESDIVIDSNPQAPTLNNAINAVSNATRTLRLGEEKEQGSAIRQGYEWRIRMSMEILKTMWGIALHGVVVNSHINDAQALFPTKIELLDVSTSTLRLLYNDIKNKSFIRQLDFESDIIALCEKALLILRSMVPSARHYPQDAFNETTMSLMNLIVGIPR